MDIEDSSVPYRAFLRSGSYPALSQRVLRSGGVLAQAAGWFALVVTAASAGYNLTQRFATTPTAATMATAGQSIVRPAALPALASSLGQPLSLPGLERVENAILPDSREVRAPAVVDKTVAQRKRAGANVPAPLLTAAVTPVEPSAESAPELTEPAREEQIAERVRALDTATHAPATLESAPAPAAPAAPDAIDALLRDSFERQRRAGLAAKAPAAEAVKPPAPARVVTPPAQPSQPLVAAARVDAVNVRGPLSAAQLRRSVDRVKPTLSECYASAAQRAGHNRFTQVRVTVTIDEAGRVKTQPQVEGAQLPGFAECLGGAMSKLVCQAPDTGTAKAAIVLGFNPAR